MRVVAPGIVLASCAQLPAGDGDDDVLPLALAEVGVHASWAPWDQITHSAAELVVLRATWDYIDRHEEVLAWCESVPTLANPAGVVRWNSDKAYLVELAAAGLPVVPTELAAPGAAAPCWPDDEVVVKPAVGAGSRDSGRFGPGEHAAARRHLARLHASGRTALVQPYQSAVDEEGEIALVFFAGVYSHAFAKGPMLNGSIVHDSGLFVSERLWPVAPNAAQRELAEDVLDVTCARCGLRRADLLYARVDMVGGRQGSPLLPECGPVRRP
jgi:hypothetical protein